MPAEPPRADAATPRRPLGPRLLLGALAVLAPVALLLLLVELALAALGLGGARTGQDLSRGFDPSVAYVVPDADSGGHRTQMFDDPAREVVLPPKGGRPRVLLFGGSNTQQLWAPLLELAFREAGAALEVLNLGREGYGSARVAILLEQALVARPDLVVLYCGHNEFLEATFLHELDAAAGVADTWLARAARSLRSYRLLVDALRPAPRLWSEPDDDAAPPPPLTGREGDWTRAETEQRYAAYRANLERMVSLAEAAGARVVLCTLVGNPLSPPYVDLDDPEVDPDARQRARRLRGRALRAVPERFTAVLRPPLRVRVNDWYEGPGLPPGEPAPRLRPLHGALADTRATSGGKTDSVEGAHWPDPALWSPPVLRLVRGMETLMARAVTPDERAALEGALALLDEALDLDPRAPQMHFDRGLVLWLLRRDADAVAAFDRARDHDAAPGSANARINAVVRDVAAAHPRALLLDADALFRARVPSGLLGYEVLMDRCHLQPGARWVLLADIAALIAEPLGLPPPATR